jgi:hypothetical protein
MIPHVTIMVLELEIVKKQIENSDFNRKLEIVKKRIENRYVDGQMWWNKKLPDLAPINPPIPVSFLRNCRGQAPTWEFL